MDDSIRCKVIESSRMSDCYRKLIEDKRIGASEELKKFFYKVILPGAVKAEAHDEEECSMVLNKFIAAICTVNMKLATTKPFTHRTRKTRVVDGGTEPLNAPNSRQIIRAYGNLTIKSQKPVRAASEETIRKYHIAAWNTRGHIRKYKSGKVAYIQPSVHHRKCMDQTASAMRTVIVAK